MSYVLNLSMSVMVKPEILNLSPAKGITRCISFGLNLRRRFLVLYTVPSMCTP